MNDSDIPHPWGWTAARRAKQAQAIRRWKPWLKSQGPVTVEGKSRVAKNACKPGSVRRQIADMMAKMKAVTQRLRKLKAARRQR